MTDRPGDGGKGTDPIDTPFETVCDPTRRALCRYVLQVDADLVTHDELLEYLVERSPNAGAGDGNAVSTGSRDRHREAIEAELRHVHLPKLDDAGIVEYDPRSGAAYVDREELIVQLEHVRAAITDLLAAPDGG